MNLFINTSVTDLTISAVVSATDFTPATLRQLVQGDTLDFTVKFLSALSTYESWSGQAGYTLTLSLGLPSSNGTLLFATNSTFSQITNGWSGRLALTSAALASAIAAVLGCQPRRTGVTMALQVSVTDSGGNRITYAELPVFVRALVGTSGQAAPA